MPAVAMASVMVAMTPSVMPMATAAVMPVPATTMVMAVMVTMTLVTTPAVLSRDDPALRWAGNTGGRCERRSLRRTGGGSTDGDDGCQEPGP